MPTDLNLESLEKALRALGEKPILQAIAIYDCEQTRENVISIEYKAPFESVALTFMGNAGPIIRWFFKQEPMRLRLHRWEEAGEDYDLFPKYIPAAINSYGFALVMSQKSFDAWTKAIGSEPGLSILQPKVYDLNKKEPSDAR